MGYKLSYLILVILEYIMDNYEVVKLHGNIWGVIEIISGKIIYSGNYKNCLEYWETH